MRLNRHIECRYCLVADEEIRFDRQRAGDADARALSAGKLVREATGECGVKADALHHLGHISRFVFGINNAVHDGCFADDVFDTVARIQRCIRILKNHLRFELHGAFLVSGH